MPALQQKPTQQANLQIHIDDQANLFDAACRQSPTTELVCTPAKLHRRNLKRRLAALNIPRSSFHFTDIAKVAETLTDSVVRRPHDRMDRLELLQSELEEDIPSLCRVVGSSLTDHVEEIEALREELTLIAGTGEFGIERLNKLVTTLSGVAAKDTGDLVAGVQTVVNRLDSASGRPLTTAALLRNARQVVAETDGERWEEHFGHINALHVSGLSTLGTPLLYFLATIARYGSTVHLYLRSTTGPRILSRLPERLAAGSFPDLAAAISNVSDPTPSTLTQASATEVVAETPQQEARAAMGVVDGLCRRGVPPTDIVVVARDAGTYERVLNRAATAYGRRTSVWTTLDVEQTIPYRLAVSLCTLYDMSDDPLPIGVLTKPCLLGWVQSTEGDRWPLEATALSQLERTLENQEHTVTGWHNRLRETATCEDNRLAATATSVGIFADHVSRISSAPTRADIRALSSVIERFDEQALPDYLKNSQNRSEVAQTAHAVNRMEELLEQTATKYGTWTDRHYRQRSWDTVIDVLAEVAAMRPGRREHHNAEKVDVLDGTDTYLRKWPYVVAVGLVDGVWPQPSTGRLPMAARQAIIEGSEFAVRGAWTDERDRDFFVDTVTAATRQLFVTRHTHDIDGIAYEPSPLLSELETSVVSPQQTKELLNTTRNVPNPIAAAYQGGETDE
jgi:ATP-dependent helicase/nuclease subunit B